MSRKEAIEKVLRSLGVNRTLTGYDITIEALNRVLDDREYLLMRTKALYPEIAEKFKTTIYAAERNIRTCSRRAYTTNPELLQKMAGYPIKKVPPVGEFLDILAGFIERSM